MSAAVGFPGLGPHSMPPFNILILAPRPGRRLAAVSLAFGVVFATVITLFLVPIGYLILEMYILKTDGK